jgi:AraC-like DNA-binding protein
MHSATVGGRAIITFSTHPGPGMFRAGLEMRPTCILRLSEGDNAFHRSTGAARWGAMSLPVEAMVLAGAEVGGCDLAPPRATRSVTPQAAAMARLQHLHAAIAQLAEHAPATFSRPEAVHSLEQSLVGAMICCLSEAAGSADTLALQHQGLIMRRFRRALELHRDQPVYIPELCAEIGVSDRALRACCRRQLGIGPHRYLLLRRMHLVRRALLGRAPGETTVTDMATRYGFWQFGRFAQEYKSLFGELPSATLAREPVEKP